MSRRSTSRRSSCPSANPAGTRTRLSGRRRSLSSSATRPTRRRQRTWAVGSRAVRRAAMSPRRCAIGCHPRTGTSAPTPSICATSTSISGDGRHGRFFGDGDPSRIEGRERDRQGIVSFITVAGFLNRPGFQKMRAELRRDADEIWIVDCSPEGHQPEVRTRIFQGVQQPVCIVHGVAEHGCWFVRPCTGPIPRSAVGASGRQVCGARRDHARRQRVDRVLFGFPRLVLPQGRWGVGRLCAPWRPLCLRWLRCDARTDLGYRTGSRFARASVGGASGGIRYQEEGNAFPSTSSGRRSGRQARQQDAPKGNLRP